MREESTVKKLGIKVVAMMVIVTTLWILAAAAVSATSVSGGGEPMPWEGPMDRILNSLSGPVAKAIGVIAIVATGLGLAFGEGGGGFRKMLQIVFGLSIAFSASTFFLGFFNFTGGCSF